MKKFLTVIILAATVLSLCFISGCSGEAKVNFKLSEDGTHYVVSEVSGNKDKLTRFEIPETYSGDGVNFLPVTEIGERAFYGCYYLSDVKIPDSVTKIGNRAFALCAFSSVTIPVGVIEIEWSAFAKCEELREIVIPESVQTIGMYAFRDCAKLKNVVIKAPITTISYMAFANMYAVGETAYTRTSMEKIYLPATVEKINRNAFDGNFFIKEIYFEGGEEQWNNIKFYGYSENPSGEAEEVESSFAETFVSNPHLNFNSNYKADY